MRRERHGQRGPAVHRPGVRRTRQGPDDQDVCGVRQADDVERPACPTCGPAAPIGPIYTMPMPLKDAPAPTPGVSDPHLHQREAARATTSRRTTRSAVPAGHATVVATTR